MNTDMVNHPPHYNMHPSGVECIDIVQHMPFNIGTAVKYLWRCDHKHPDALEDLRKAEWFIKQEIKLRESQQDPFENIILRTSVISRGCETMVPAATTGGKPV